MKKYIFEAVIYGRGERSRGTTVLLSVKNSFLARNNYYLLLQAQLKLKIYPDIVLPLFTLFFSNI